MYVFAQEPWPDNISIEAEGGIVMDADTGAVLYGKNLHEPYFPASITKILTALIVIENCDLNEKVTFSHNAVYNVEAGSSNAGLDEGDVLTVRDCLYALLLKSANESANALAEHVAGTTEAFAAMMNEKAAALGCTDSHFANPSGLNDPQHYVSAYDMALIGQAALGNDTFVSIDSSRYYDLPVTKRNPEGLRIYPGHRMLKKNMAEYYAPCIGGKTGYTSLAGNTLVTFARKDDMTLVSVVLNSHQTHYSDTKTMMEFGFRNFQTVSAAEYDTTYTSIENDMVIGGIPTSEFMGLRIDPSCKVTLPRTADFSSVTSELSYDLSGTTDTADTGHSGAAGAVAKINYSWNGRKIGEAFLSFDTSRTSYLTDIAYLSVADNDSVPAQAHPQPEKNASHENPYQNDSAQGNPSQPDSSHKDKAENGKQENGTSMDNPVIPFFASHPVSPLALGLSAMAALSLGAGIALSIRITRQKKKEAEELQEWRRRRLQRLSESGISQQEFDYLLEQRRSSYAARQDSKKRPRKGRGLHF